MNKKYIITFSLFGKKMRTKISGSSEIVIKAKFNSWIKDKIKLLSIEEENEKQNKIDGLFNELFGDLLK